MKAANILIILIVNLFIISCAASNSIIKPELEKDNIFQYGTMQNFLNRNYDGTLTIKELKQNGDFGLGTFNGVNGEMVVSDGKVYRVSASGEIFEVEENELSPYAVVKFFNPDTSIILNKRMGFVELKNIITNNISDSSKPVAIRIIGKYEKVKTRTVNKQSRPYPPLTDIIENQIEFNFKDINGSAIGFWFPDYFAEVNFPSYHFHFLTNGKSGGGHLLDCTISNVIIELDFPDELFIKF